MDEEMIGVPCIHSVEACQSHLIQCAQMYAQMCAGSVAHDKSMESEKESSTEDEEYT